MDGHNQIWLTSLRAQFGLKIFFINGDDGKGKEEPVSANEQTSKSLAGSKLILF